MDKTEREPDSLLIWLGVIRLRRGFTQNHVANQLDNVSVRTLQRWERGQGNPRLSQLRQLMALYEVSGFDTLIGDLSYREVLPEDVRAAITLLPNHYRRPLIDLILVLAKTHSPGVNSQ